MKPRTSCVFLAVALWMCGSFALADDGQSPQVQFLRINEEPSKFLALEIATVDMVPAEGSDGPRIGLVGVAHIGDAAFYKAIQDVLNAYDIVLFEAVQPVQTRIEDEDPEARAKHTRSSMHFVASAIEAYKHANEHYPQEMQSLIDFVADTAPIVSNWLNRAVFDAWGAPLQYERDEEGQVFTIRSIGGEEVLEMASDEPVSPLDLEQNNLQQQLADALSLEFQLRALTYDAPNWRPSDMTVAQLNTALARHGVDFAVVGGTLAGTSFPARMISGLLRIVGALDAMSQGVVSDMMKIMMIELLGNESVLEMSIGQFGEGFTTVIIDERNQVVVDDLANILRNEPEVTSIAVLYGAAHMADFVERLEQQLGYVTDETQWLSAISVDFTTSQMHPRQVQRTRLMIRNMLQQQLRAADRSR